MLVKLNIVLFVAALVCMGCGWSCVASSFEVNAGGNGTGGLEIFSAQEIEANLSKYDRNILKVKGYVNNTSTNIPRLYKNFKAAQNYDIREAIDVSPTTGVIRASLNKINGIRCVIVGGTFRAYTKNYFGFGNAASKYGRIIVLSVNRCKDPKVESEKGKMGPSLAY